MSLESHGGVADQITNLAVNLPRYGVQPVVLVRNPLGRNQAYAKVLRQNRILVWAFSDKQYRLVKAICTMALCLSMPLLWVSALVGKKTLSKSKQSFWGVMRRLGYAALDVAFLAGLVTARTFKRSRLVHFRKPDAWPMIPRAKRLGFCTIYTEDTEPQPDTQQFYDGLTQVQQSIDCLTAVSRASALAVRLNLSQPLSITIVPNMVDLPNNVPTKKHEHEGFVVGCIARLAPQKDIETLVLAARQALSQMPNLRFIVHGDGPLRANLESLSRRLGLEGSLTFPGAFAKPQLSEVLSNMDLVILSSLWEGFGVSLVEGMAFSKPAVATSVGGVPEVVIDGITGILVPPRSPKALADAILTLAQDRQLYDRMSKAARERYLTHYSSERVMPQYLAVYRQALGHFI